MMPADLDHLVLAGPDLAAARAWFTELTGVAPAPGGRHAGWGTANELVGLGGAAYLEIIGPDPEQPAPERPRPFAVDELAAPRVVTWALRTTDIEATLAAARAAGYDPGDPVPMARRTPEGGLLEWRLTEPRLDRGAGLVPFVIDWGATAHPTARQLPETPLLDFVLRHPDPATITGPLAALGVDVEVKRGELAGITAVVQGPTGAVRL
jgi:hypothetical protein